MVAVVAVDVSLGGGRGGGAEENGYSRSFEYLAECMHVYSARSRILIRDRFQVHFKSPALWRARIQEKCQSLRASQLLCVPRAPPCPHIPPRYVPEHSAKDNWV